MRDSDLGVRRAGCQPNFVISVAPFLSLGSHSHTCPMRVLVEMTSSDRPQCELHQTGGPAFSLGLCTAWEQLASLRTLVQFPPKSTKAAHGFPSPQPPARPVPSAQCLHEVHGQ